MNKVTEEHLDSIVVSKEFHRFEDTTVTVCLLTVKNGWTAIGHRACADPENFDAAEGEKWAYKDALSKLWALEGYLLKEKLYKGN